MGKRKRLVIGKWSIRYLPLSINKTSSLRQFKAWLLRLIYHKRLVTITMVSSVFRLFDIVVSESYNGNKKKYKYVGKNKFLMI